MFIITPRNLSGIAGHVLVAANERANPIPSVKALKDHEALFDREGHLVERSLPDTPATFISLSRYLVVKPSK